MRAGTRRTAQRGAHRAARRWAWLTVALLSGCSLSGTMAPRGIGADVSNGLWWFMFWISAAIFVGWTALFLYGAYRRQRPDADPEGEARLHRRFIIGGGIILPLVVFGVLFVYDLGALNAQPSGDDVVVDATGYQYWWEFGYTDPEFVTANEMYIPTGTDVRVRLHARDVIHSFWVPELSGKRDMVPGEVNELTLHAREPGRYLGECAEFCGLQHTHMRFEVVAVPPEEYAAWLEHMAQPAAEPQTTAEQVGYDTFMNSSCAACHTIRGTPADGRKGPELTHFAARRLLGAGAAPNDRGHLGGWVVNSQGLKPGNPMPPIEIDAEGLPDLVTYLQSLE